ncbi:hypothetical protein, partial [Rhodococcus gannanensis]
GPRAPSKPATVTVAGFDVSVGLVVGVPDPNRSEGGQFGHFVSRSSDQTKETFWKRKTPGVWAVASSLSF